MSPQKPTVLVIGATGRTGLSVINGLLESGQYNVAALTRPASASKPDVSTLRGRGVEIRVGDFTADPPAKLAEYLKGIEVLLSTVSAEAILDQKPILKAAVDARVNRIIPCDFGTPGGKGVRSLHDLKYDVREYLQELTIASNGRSAYTFIDIGWWAQLAVPGTATAPSLLGPVSDEYYTSDDKPSLLTDVEHIGPWVARIVGDPRTANQYVIVWEDELPLRESKAIAEVASGEEQVLRAKRSVLDKDALLKRAAESHAKYNQNKDFASHAAATLSEYMISIHFLGENSLANAKKLGALDAKELYPDIVQTSFKEYVKAFYGQGRAQ